MFTNMFFNKHKSNQEQPNNEQLNPETNSNHDQLNPETNSNNKIKLKNGTEIDFGLLRTTMAVVNKCMEIDPIILFELVEKCKDQRYEMFVSTERAAEKLGLMNKTVSQATCNVLFSSVVIDNDIRIESPVDNSTQWNNR